MLYTKNFVLFCFDVQNNICTQHVLYLYFSGNSMNNLLSYCGLTDARMRASEKGQEDMVVHKEKHAINLLIYKGFCVAYSSFLSSTDYNCELF